MRQAIHPCALIDAIKAEVKAQGVSYTWIGKCAGLHRRTIARFMAGSHGITLRTASQLCAVLGMRLKKSSKRG